jgi:predicted phage replisome organizer
MRERKFVKLRVDMHEDTKFKIIDKMKERDLVHYIWIRLVTLAGKVNLEGSLYLSRNIPYTIETLAIEFNRDTEQVKLALRTLMDLEMIELLKDKIYRVKNFAKHQNIKIEEKVEFQDNMEDINHKELIIENQLGEEKHVDSEHQICESIEKAPENQVIIDKSINYEIINKEKIDSNCKNIKDYQFISDLQSNIPISLEKKKPKKVNKNTSRNISCIDENGEGNKQDDISGVFEGEHSIPMGKDDRVIMAFSV